MPALVMLLYLLSAALFIFGLKRLSSPATAVSGNRLASVGMKPPETDKSCTKRHARPWRGDND